MSDCSTEATKPKEPPKTCGSCGNVEVTIHKVRCPHRRYPMERFRDWIGYPRYEHYAEYLSYRLIRLGVSLDG